MTSSAHRIEVKAVRLPNGLGLPLPQYQTDGAAGMDLMAAVPLTAPLRLLPGMRQQVPTGLAIEIPPGFEGQVRPRSGLALNHGVTVLNAPGTIDCDYRGELKVLLVNLGRETFVITRGQRIAQLVVAAVVRVEMVDVRAVAASRRGEAGFGSTGSGVITDTVGAAVVSAGAAAKPTAPTSRVRKPVVAASIKSAAAASAATPSRSAAPVASGSGKTPASAGIAPRKPAFAPANNPGHTDRGARAASAAKASSGKVAAQEEPPPKELAAEEATGKGAGGTAAVTKKAVLPAAPKSASASMARPANPASTKGAAPSKSALGKSSPAKGKASSRA